MKNGIAHIQLKNPQASYCGNYIVIASKNGNEIALLDNDGQMKNSVFLIRLLMLRLQNKA